MNIRKWGSSHPAVLDGIPEEHSAKVVDLSGLGACDDPNGQLALGMCWATGEDVFLFLALEIPTLPWTPRRITSFFLRIFDPLGLIAPFIVAARKIFQHIWKQFPEWEKKVPLSALKPWHAWLVQLPAINDFRFDRCLNIEGEDHLVKSTRLHVFSDVSELAYGAAAYLQVEYVSGRKHTSLIMSKSRVAPLVFKSVPRLELAAALLGLVLAKHLLKPLGLELDDTTFWVDSQVVLAWIYSMSKCLNTYAANRVGNMHEDTHPSQWLFVNSARNPPDILSRGSTPEELQACHIWFHGPDFITSDVPPPPNASFRCHGRGFG
jgi:hypothetical protein